MNKNKSSNNIKQEIILTNNLKEIIKLNHVIDGLIIEKEDIFKSFIIDIIELSDFIKRIRIIISEKELSIDENSRKVVKKYESVNKRIDLLLKKHGAYKINFPENKLIIGYCKVIETVSNFNLPNDYIVEIIKDGYIRGSVIIREAEVVIVRN